MDKIALLLIPGFFSFLRILNNDQKLNAPPNQWVLIPLLLIYSGASLILANIIMSLLISGLNILTPDLVKADQIFVFRCIHLFSSGDVVDVFHHKIALFEYLLSCFLGYFLCYMIPFFNLIAPLSVMDSFLLRNKAKPLMISMNNKKVYIGVLRENDYWSGDGKQVLRISPQLSGFRSEENNRVEINANYLKLNGEGIDWDAHDSTNIVNISKSNVITCREFDYSKFAHYCISGSIQINDKLVLKNTIITIEKATENNLKRNSSLTEEDIKKRVRKVREKLEGNQSLKLDKK